MDLCLKAVSTINAADLERIAGDLAAHFALDVRIGEPLSDPAAAFDPRRRQYGSEILLRELIRTRDPGAYRLLGVTECDLFIPMLSFVFGQAQLDGFAAILSLARLRQEFYGLPPAPSVLFARISKEAVHELGHTFGLIHCADTTCPMSLSTGIAQVDTKSDRYCPACAAQLRDRGVPVIAMEKSL